MNILVVDDSQLSRCMVGRYLEAVGPHHRFMFSGDGDIARDLIEEGGIDVVLTDLYMPGLDGFELIRAIADLKLAKPPSIIVITATAADDPDWHRLDFHVLAVLQKPVSPMDLARALYLVQDVGFPDHGVDQRCRAQWSHDGCDVFTRGGERRPDDGEQRCHRPNCAMEMFRGPAHAHAHGADAPAVDSYEGPTGAPPRTP